MGGDLQQILCVCAAPFTHPIPSHPTHRQTQRRCLLVFSHVDYIIYHRYQAPRRSLCAALGLIFSVNLELNANLFAQSCFQMFSICVSMLYGLYVCLCLHIHTPPHIYNMQLDMGNGTESYGPQLLPISNCYFQHPQQMQSMQANIATTQHRYIHTYMCTYLYTQVNIYVQAFNLQVQIAGKHCNPSDLRLL